MDELYAFKISELGSKAPEFIQIAPLGILQDGQGRKFEITPEVVRKIIDVYSNRENDLVIDYEYQTKVVVIETIPMTLAAALDLNESATISDAEATVLALKQKMETGESARVEELASECFPSAKSGPAPQMRKVSRSQK